jgi:LPXTG-motif cell wall-anchored protein
MLTGITPARLNSNLIANFEEDPVDVVVNVTGGGTVTLTLGYTYLPPRPTPVVMTLFPPLGPTSGGTELTITGENLGGSNQAPPVVFVNGSAATSVTVSEDGSVVSVLTPPGPAGRARDVELFTNEGAAGFVSAFTYIPPIPPLSPLVSVPVATAPIVTTAPPRPSTTTTVPPSPTNTVPGAVTPNTAPPGVVPVPVVTADGETALPELLPGESQALDNGVPIPVSIAIENTTDLVMSGEDWQLRLRGDCTVRVCTIEEQNGREVLELEVDGAANVGGFGFLPGTLVHVWLFSDPIYLGSLLVAADGTYSGPVDLFGVEAGLHTLQVNGISFDGKERTANLGVVVRALGEPGGRLPATGSSGTSSMVLLAVLMTALGLVLVSHRVRRRPS